MGEGRYMVRAISVLKSALVFLFLIFAALPATAAHKPGPKPTNEDCLTCHSDSSLTKDINGKPVSLYVNPDKFKDSIHGSMFTCMDCHTDVKTALHEKTPAKITCASCHADQQAAYERSFHAKAIKAGDTQAATCVDCHGSPHELLPASDPKSRVHHGNIPATCGSCHGQKFVMEPSGHSEQAFFSYQESVHGRAIAAGSEKAAVCTDCHGVHEILAATDSQSSIFKFNVPETCGKCHGNIKKEFMESIHGQAVARGNGQSPVCTDCHGIHAIKSHFDPNSSVSARNMARSTCGRCHEGVRLSQEFGVEGRRLTTYLESYHGLASQLGAQVVANCASCHGVHNILPSSDPRSTISRANLVKTCGQCHPGVTEKFVSARVHVDAPLSSDAGSTAVRWVRKFYFLLIGLVIGGMVFHNVIIWRHKALRRRKTGNAMVTVTRMSRNQRWQHTLLFISFITLVLTGFALRFPDSWFAAMLGMGEHVRALTHRVAAVVLIGISVYHIAYVIISRDGRSFFRAVLPEFKDVQDSWRTLRHYLGGNVGKPVFGRFNYAEKAEYWALIWGTIVMGATGVMLWAKVSVGNMFPRWWLDLAMAIHFYEALLATLAIVIWHFYHVFFDPDMYPMNWAWWDGKVPLENYREEHGLDTETLRGAVEPPSANSETKSDTAAAPAENSGPKQAPTDPAK